MEKASEIKIVKWTQIGTIGWSIFLHEAVVIKKFSAPSSSDLDASRSSFYFVLRSRLHFSYLCRIRDGTVMKKSMDRYIRLGIRMYDSTCPCEPSCSVRSVCIRVYAAWRADISASAEDPCCHFIQTWSQPNTKIRTWRPASVHVS